jgi:hypothetical protein
LAQSWIGGLCAPPQVNKPNYPRFISPKSAPSLTLIKLPVWAWVKLAHPFADFLPSFWAKGILRALDILYSSVRFSLLTPFCQSAPEPMAA